MSRFFWLAGLVIVVPLLLGGCGPVQADHPSASPTPTLTPTPTLVIYVTTDGPNFAESDPSQWCGPVFALVADATISALGPSHWNTPDHSPPPTLDRQAIIAGGYAIFTPMQFSHMTPLVDHRQQPTQEYMSPGGQVGPVKMIRGGTPPLIIGKRYVLLFEGALDRQAQAFTQTTLQLVAAFLVKDEGLAQIQQKLATGK